MRVCSTLCDSDAEYELEEVWDGKQWHVTKKLVSKKPATSKDLEKLGKLCHALKLYMGINGEVS